MIGIAYDGFSLQGNGIFVTGTDVYSAPAKSIQAEKLAEADGAVIVKTTYEPKVFSIEGYITASTIAATDVLLDTFKGALNKLNASFDIDYAGSIRRYIATPRNMVISREKGLNTAGFTVEFLCAIPVGSDLEATDLLSTTLTSGDAPSTFQVDGSYMAEPLITATITAVTGGTPDKALRLANGATLRGITIIRDWAAGDVIEVDCLNKTVYVNDVATDFTGQIPSWQPGSGSLSYSDEFSTRSVDIVMTYVRRFL